MRSWAKWTGIAAAVGLVGTSAIAADHGDGAAAKAAPSSDINDVYTWVQDGKLVLIMSIGGNPNTLDALDPKVVYRFNVHRHAAAVVETVDKATDTTTVDCKPNGTDLECWVVGADGKTKAYVKGDATGEQGLESDDKTLKVFNGLRSDPFFFYLGGLAKAVETVRGAVPLVLNGTIKTKASGCPVLDAATVNTLQAQLTGQPGNIATDDFAKNNVVALVATVDLKLLGGTGDFVGVWGSTHEAM
jgi:hypothetical protein